MRKMTLWILFSAVSLALCSASLADPVPENLPEKLRCLQTGEYFCYSNGECNNIGLHYHVGLHMAKINFQKLTMKTYDGEIITKGKLEDINLKKRGELIASWDFDKHDEQGWRNELFSISSGFQLESMFYYRVVYGKIDPTPNDGTFLIYNCPFHHDGKNVGK